MELVITIPVRKTSHPKIGEVNWNELEFGKYTSDHMLVCDYAEGNWGQAQVVPFTDLSLNPLTLALHYGQTVFEGMKAFRMEDGRINLFRVKKHYDRFRKSLERMCMAVPPKEVFIEGLIQLVKTDGDWVPNKKGSALYVRPFVYASEAKMGLKVSEQYRFVICTGPVPELYARPVKVRVETQYVRAGKGGTGFTKCGGNYGGAFYPTQLAKNEGFDQVLWTDGKENKFIEESGMMNAMFVIDNTLITPPLSDSILDGVTRDSLLTLATDMGYAVVERPVSLEELEKSFINKSITEAFGAGTAAVVAPIQMIQLNGIEYHLPPYHAGSLSARVKLQLERIRTGQDADIYGWNLII